MIFAGKEYGTGSSRDWAAKGTRLSGRARRDRPVLRAHPPLQPDRHGRAAAAVHAARKAGSRSASAAPRSSPFTASAEGLKPRKLLKIDIAFADGCQKASDVLCRIDTLDELDYFRHGGILPYVLEKSRQSSLIDDALIPLHAISPQSELLLIALCAHIKPDGI